MDLSTTRLIARLDTLVGLQCNALLRGEDPRATRFRAWAQEEARLESFLIETGAI